MKKNFFSLIILFVICPLILWYVHVSNITPFPPPTPTPSSSDTAVVTHSSLLSNPPLNLPTELKSFTNVPNVPSGTFNYGGSTTWAPIRKIVDKEIQKAKPQFKMNYINSPAGETPGSNTGIRMLLQNKLDFSLSSRSLNSNERQQGLTDKNVAIDGIAIAVNPELNIEGLTVDQLKGIYTAKIKNWSNIIPSLNVDIKPYTRDPNDGGTVDYFLNDVLKIKIADLGSNVEFTEDTTEGIRKVRNNRGGIYYASASELVGDCNIKPLPIGWKPGEFVTPYKPPFIARDNKCPRFKNKMKVNTEAFLSGKYPITRKLFVIIKSNDQRKQQAGEAYTNLLLTDQGQELVEKAGFLNLNHTPAK